MGVGGRRTEPPLGLAAARSVRVGVPLNTLTPLPPLLSVFNTTDRLDGSHRLSHPCGLNGPDSWAASVGRRWNQPHD